MSQFRIVIREKSVLGNVLLGKELLKLSLPPVHIVKKISRELLERELLKLSMTPVHAEIQINRVWLES